LEDAVDPLDEDLDKGLEIVDGVRGREKSCSAKMAARFFAEERYMNWR
jgi:hypothetical protein